MKPNTLCVIVRDNVYPDVVGRIVTAVRPMGDDWMVEAGWLKDGPWWAHRTQLRPISDPDIDTTETTDALHDSLVAALAEARS